MDLARMAGCTPVGVLCEIVKDEDGSMARLPDLKVFSEKHGLKMVLISDMIRYRRARGDGGAHRLSLADGVG